MSLTFYKWSKLHGKGQEKLFLILTQWENAWLWELLSSVIFSLGFPPEISNLLLKPTFTVSLYWFLKFPMFHLTKFCFEYDKRKLLIHKLPSPFLPCFQPSSLTAVLSSTRPVPLAPSATLGRLLPACPGSKLDLTPSFIFLFLFK